MTSILNQVLRNPPHIKSMSARQWDFCIRQANHSKLLGRLYAILEHHGLIENVPERPLSQLRSSYIKATSQHRDILFEARSLANTLSEAQIEVVFLKGAAYVINGIASEGRTCNDVDILVPITLLPRAEQQLNNNGWAQEDLSIYDASYYRKWMHELPPMVHLERQTVLDVHHHILPKTARTHFDINIMLNDRKAHQLNYRGQTITVFTLSEFDRLLHSAQHLFSEGELDKGLRDLSDISMMLNALLDDNKDNSIELINRAEQLGLDYPLQLALRAIDKQFYMQHDLTPFRQHHWRKNKFNGIRLKILDWCFSRLFIPHHPSATNISFYIAQWIIYMRSHHLRMPLRLLLPHLSIKWWHSIKTSLDSTP